MKSARGQATRKKGASNNPILAVLAESITGMTTQDIARELGKDRSTIHKQAVRLHDSGILDREQIPGGSNLWRLPNNA